MKTNEIRQKYLDFFQSKGHTVCQSDVLVPRWDPTVLFTPAGMNPFKDHFLGKIELEFTRATSCQKCLRTGDIENVGRTAYHHTFFEMLGNFSFGDYFKREAIGWAWEFLTDKKWMGIDPNRLTVTVYQDDDEAAEIWQNEIGIASRQITRLGEHDNFWPAGAPSEGPDGVCGPCSEIFFHPDHGPECEIWNLVFTQFNRYGNPPDNLTPLPAKNIDTGMGLERMAAVMQGVETNFHIDSLLPLVEACGDVCGIGYDPASDHGRRLRRIADHVRACTMAIHENVFPDKQKENYVIRRLLRRADLQGHEMGLREPFLYRIVPAVVAAMGQPYPDLRDTADHVADVIRNEETAFFRTLDEGLVRVEEIFSAMKTSNSTVVDGKAAFDLYQEQGIPAELFESLARDRGLGFDREGYDQARDQHAIDSGAGQVGVMGNFGPVDEIKQEVKSTEFLGYACTSDQGTVRGLISGDQSVDEIGTSETRQALILDRTPFYAESGGQVGDTGIIAGSAGTFRVTDVQKSGALFVHHGQMDKGRMRKGDVVSIEVDVRRRNGIQRAHTATHIMHYALQKYLGEHAQQRGSKVEQDQLRFDFSNRQAVPDGELLKIEAETIRRVQEGSEVQAEILPMEEARRQGAMMLFGEKYPDPVRMVSVGEFSKELCGGTHVANTSEIDGFEIIAEEAVSSGTRRIVALTGDRARQNAEFTLSTLGQMAELLKVAATQLVEATDRLLKQAKSLKKQLAGGNQAKPPAVIPDAPDAARQSSYAESRETLRQSARLLNVPPAGVVDRMKTLQADIADLEQQIGQLAEADDVTPDSLWERVARVADINLVVGETPGVHPDKMRTLVDQLRKKHASTAVFLASIQAADKVTLIAGLSQDLVDRGLSAGDWVKHVAPCVGGGGGGRADMARAGGKQPEKINVALDAAREFLRAASVS